MNSRARPFGNSHTFRSDSRVAAQANVTVGTGLLPLQDALKPNITEPPLGTLPFHDAFEQLTVAPVWVQIAFHA